MSIISRFTLALAALFLTAAMASANPVQWSLSGTFISETDPTDIVQLTGQFYYDASTNTYGSYSFMTSEIGTAMTSAIDLTGSWVINQACCYPVNGAFILTDGTGVAVSGDGMSGGLIGVDGITVVADASLPDETGTSADTSAVIPFDNISGAGFSATCGLVDCSEYFDTGSGDGYKADGTGTFTYTAPAPTGGGGPSGGGTGSGGSVTPEPSTFMLGGSVLMAFGLIRRRAVRK